MDELAEDPSVLGAALALVDEMYVTTMETRSSDGKSPGVASTVSVGLRKRAYDELTRLRATLQEVEHRVVAKRYRRRLQEHTASDVIDADTPLITPMKASSRAQAIRFLEAVQSYNMLNPAMSLTEAATDRASLREVNEARILDTLRGRLDLLYKMAKAAPLMTVRTVPSEPALTDIGFREDRRLLVSFPFKLSAVAEVFWKLFLGSLYGSYNEKPLAAQLKNEVIFMTERSQQVPSGLLSSAGLAAIRRVYEEDGSVLFLYTTVKSAPHQSGDTSESSQFPNLLAGMTVKEAGWTRIRRQLDSTKPQKAPIVILEMAQSMVVESSSGSSVSQDRLRRIWHAVDEASQQEPYTYQTTENRLMDANADK